LRRLVALLVEATAHLLNNRPLPASTGEIAQQRMSPSGYDIWRQSLHGYMPKIARQFVKPFMRLNDWCIGYRRRRDPAHFPDDLDLRPETFTPVQSPPSHFYADPFLFEKDGTISFFSRITITPPARRRFPT
jgi:hypothetical protein